MQIVTLAYINGRMQEIGIPYAFMEWTEEEKPETYFVGSYLENPSRELEENGHQETTFILRGWTNGSWMNLETYKEKIEKNIMKTAILDDGTGIAIFYDSAIPVPTYAEGWKSIKINLKIQEWKVN
jgi:hypothetical protein